MGLDGHVRVARRYRRAIGIDADLGDPAALEGFVCPPSSAEALGTMARHVRESGQGAFTWTGPYGAGKSSLAVVLAAALGGDGLLRGRSETVLGDSLSELLASAFPRRRLGWRVLPVAGRRDRPAQAIGEAIGAAGFAKRRTTPRVWTDLRVLDTLESLAARAPVTRGGLMVLIDEMGKFLEAAARDGSDIHLFQQLAERASRSGGRLIVVGILHQSFEEYAHRLSREMRDEWAKVQGRFVDLAISASGEEQIVVLGRAIENGRGSVPPGASALNAARLVGPAASPRLACMLEACWPLHPLTACLLGPLSRRRFGQNQRSVFGFLNSAEPGGFQDFLRDATELDFYRPDRLWDYLRINLEPSILASPDGHRWALAAEALRRCDAAGGDELEVRLLKTIALADLLKDRSGLPARGDFLVLAHSDYAPTTIHAALERLQSRSLVVYRRFADAWAIFEGSDFDIERAVEEASRNDARIETTALDAVGGLRPIVAKRHYHETGALRWFDVAAVPVAEIERAAARHARHGKAAGVFLLAIPTGGETDAEARRLCRRATAMFADRDVVAGCSPAAWGIPALAAELAALELVRESTPELQGDRVARAEVLARISSVRDRLETELARALDGATWRWGADGKATSLSRAALSGLASDLADTRFERAPRLHNELLGRARPSSSAAAARNVLLRRMVVNEREQRLGIEGFPAEGGLYASLLHATGLHRVAEEGCRFAAPDGEEDDPARLAPAWEAARRLLRENKHRAVTVSELYCLWRKPPFGVKDGLLPVLAVAFFLSRRGELALYREGVFQSRMTDLDVDVLLADPAAIRLRWMDMSGVSRDLLAELANVVRELDEENRLLDLEPLEVARGLISIHDGLPSWTRRTQRLSSSARRLRELFKQAKDPNRLIFDDLPGLSPSAEDGTVDTDGEGAARRIAERVRRGLIELRQAWPALLGRLRDTLLEETRTPNASPAALAELRDRAENIRELGGDHRMEAFIVRLAGFDGTDADIEGLAGMAANKPPRNWVDPDIDRATVELAALAQRFVRAEAFARVKGRRDKRHAMAVVVGLDGRPAAIHDEFDVSEREREEVEALMERLDGVLQDSGPDRRNIVLAALAELSARHLDPQGARARVRRKRKAS